MKRHLVVPYPATNSSVRTRGLVWVDRLLAAGTLDAGSVAVHGPGFEGGRVEPNEPVLLLRNAARISRGRQEARLLGGARPGVYDIDDGLPWDDGRLPGLGRWWKRPFPRSLLAERAAIAADRVIAGNDVLAEWSAEWCRDVVIVPTCVEPAEYRPRDNDARSSRPPVIGWIGSPATEHYLFGLTSALAEVHRRTGAVVELVSGAGDLPAAMRPFATRRLWEPAATQWIGSWDVGLMPLDDGVYERAKCGYKLLQYAASGVPFVASPVGVNETMIRVGDGLPARTISDWVDAAIELIGEPTARRAQRVQAGLRLADAYSYERWQPIWIAASGWM